MTVTWCPYISKVEVVNSSGHKHTHLLPVGHRVGTVTVAGILQHEISHPLSLMGRRKNTHKKEKRKWRRRKKRNRKKRRRRRRRRRKLQTVSRLDDHSKHTSFWTMAVNTALKFLLSLSLSSLTIPQSSSTRDGEGKESWTKMLPGWRSPWTKLCWNTWDYWTSTNTMTNGNPRNK